MTDAAYYLSTRCRYEDHYDLDGWLQGDIQIDHIIMNPEPAMATEEASASVAAD